MNTVELFPSCEGILRKKHRENKFTLNHFAMFLGSRGQKGAPMRTRPYSCTWMNY